MMAKSLQAILRALSTDNANDCDRSHEGMLVYQRLRGKLSDDRDVLRDRD